MNENLIIVLTGPTGIGKTEVSLEISKIIKGIEIVSADSMAIYKDMDIGTSKPSKDFRLKVPHHMVDIVDCNQSFDVKEYVDRASAIIDNITSRDHTPLIAGGSLMYLYSLLDGIFKGPSRDNKLRLSLVKRAQEYGSDKLYSELKTVDPDAAYKIHSNDLRRIVRALEVYRLTGKRMSDLKREREGIASRYNVAIYAFFQKRSIIYKNIDKRVDDMIARGLVEEVKSLIDRISLTAYQGAGYKELIGYIKDEYSLDEALRLIKRNSRRLAKRQLSWLKRDKRISWIDVSDFSSSIDIAKHILNSLKKI